VAGDVVLPPYVALVEGFRWALYAGAALAVPGALITLVLIHAKATGDGESRALAKSNLQ
jgi:hypothetical protein